MPSWRKIAFSILLAIAVFGLVYPVYVIRPFRHQGAGELQAALLVLRYRGIAEALAAIASVLIVVACWRNRRDKIFGLVVTVLVIACGILSRVNVYERMFHPIDNPSFAAAADVKLDPEERVIAVGTGNTARAYPIRNLAYHHLVNDVAGGVPIAATY
jgi:hypothetical protein